VAADNIREDFEDDLEQVFSERHRHEAPRKRKTRIEMLDTPLMHKLFAAIAAAAVVGGGTVVLNNQGRISVLEYASATSDAHLQRIEDKLDRVLERKDVAK
jgi:hypothetical protein